MTFHALQTGMTQSSNLPSEARHARGTADPWHSLMSLRAKESWIPRWSLRSRFPALALRSSDALGARTASVCWDCDGEWQRARAAKFPGDPCGSDVSLGTIWSSLSLVTHSTRYSHQPLFTFQPYFPRHTAGPPVAW